MSTLTAYPSAPHGEMLEHIRRLSRNVPHVVRSWPLTGSSRRCRSWTPSLPQVLLHGDQSDHALYSQSSCPAADTSTSVAPSAAATDTSYIVIISKQGRPTRHTVVVLMYGIGESAWKDWEPVWGFWTHVSRCWVTMRETEAELDLVSTAGARCGSRRSWHWRLTGAGNWCSGRQRSPTNNKTLTTEDSWESGGSRSPKWA